MNLASAYPNSDMSALSLTLIAVVVALALGAWLGLVFLADRQPREPTSREPKGAPPSGLRSE